MPLSLDKLKTLINNVQGCYSDNVLFVQLWHGMIFLYLHIWNIPGAVLFNLFGGAIFGTMTGTIICLIVSKGFLFIIISKA